MLHIVAYDNDSLRFLLLYNIIFSLIAVQTIWLLTLVLWIYQNTTFLLNILCYYLAS